MNLEVFKTLSESNRWGLLLPEIFLVGLALVLLVFEMLFKRQDLLLIVRLAIWGQVLLLGLIALSYLEGFPTETVSAFSGLIQQNPATEVMRIFFITGSLLVSFLAMTYLKKQDLPRTEFLSITMLVTVGMMILVQSSQFVLFFVALETVTVGFYVLVAYCRKSPFSLEAGLKFLVLGAMSSAILLFGIVFLYGVAGNPSLPGHVSDPMNFSQLASFIAANPSHPLVLIGASLVLAGVAFKVGAVPFQIWIPDVYQGAPTPVTAFLAVSSKAAGVFVLMTLVRGPFAPLSSFLIPLLSTVAVLTILFGNLTALPQRNVKRLMGLSGIAHAGYLLVGVVASMTVDWAVYAVVFYLITYLLASFGVFGVMIHLAGDDDSDQEVDHYEDLGQRQPFLAGVLTIGLSSLAGIPPLGGFIGKLLIFIAAFQAELYGLLGAAIIGVVLSIYYYFGWIREAVFRVWRSPEGSGANSSEANPITVSTVETVTLGGLSALTIGIGLFPTLVDCLMRL
ncbi:NADH-quinone oxidoreductase subunit N [Puniceicoccus vermicola]|uniref:NADH-quinone oxidoreductase subunit N n=1 Tax=Puniceicoccus vermicola TaxID=388746 RepID=A0A7X1AVH9_9BACT|nr:NADH-quinone oxidoreductase subunit N [Puniceicoccus vermicola]MBC2600776.1 NADH-quinone oxidoreductase subunit N [Puniceicoccus vermicola]